MNPSYFPQNSNSRIPPGSRQDFVQLAEPYRRELQIHCYRMLGSLQDAEDLVQETMLRAWQKVETYDARAPFRAWLYKIATNACLDALERRPRRTLAAKRSPALTQPSVLAPPITEPIWLEPVPDDWLAGSNDEPQARYAARESITLAFLAALQFLTPRQRAVLILADVLEWRLSEIATLLELSETAVNSTLYRARLTMSKHYGSDEWENLKVETDETTRPILERFVRIWENAEVEELVTLLAEDARLAMPPMPSWYQGQAAVQSMLLGFALANGTRGAWRLVPIRASGEPAFAMYQGDANGSFSAMGLVALQIRKEKIESVTAFLEPSLFRFWNMPLTQ